MQAGSKQKRGLNMAVGTVRRLQKHNCGYDIHMYIHIYICVCLCICIEREGGREREREQERAASQPKKTQANELGEPPEPKPAELESRSCLRIPSQDPAAPGKKTRMKLS